MFNKIKSLENMSSCGLNVHRFYIPSTYEEFVDIVMKLKHCTIRTDHADASEDLPFYLIDGTIEQSYIEHIWNIAKVHNYKLIISDGVKFDNIQEYNMVVKIKENGEFIFEASELKIPLRHMYRFSMLSCQGNISDESVTGWKIYKNKYGLDKFSIKRVIEILYTYEIYDRWLEVTKYPENVGTQNKDIIFWQII